MQMEAVEYKGHWIAVEAHAGTGAWTYRIDGGPVRKFDGSAQTAAQSETVLFEKVILLAKSEVDLAGKPFDGSDEA